MINHNLIKNNKTQPIYSYEECIFEKVFVETPVDTDNDGKYDLIAVYIRRPKTILKNVLFPAIYVANPYMLSCNEDWYIPHNINKNLTVFNQTELNKTDLIKTSKKELPSLNSRKTLDFTEFSLSKEIQFEAITDWYKYFNVRGYATVFTAGLGTKESDGFNSCGSYEETLAFKSVIDWLNGRCKAFTNKTDGIEVKADWCSGKVAMTGKSYLGTMSIAVATTGVDGLKTIIPEAAISNWYEYYRYNGLNVPGMEWQGDDLDILAKYCFSRRFDDDYPLIKDKYENFLKILEKKQDRISANYNGFWDERNYLNSVANIKASVFIVHGINDWNVKLNQCIPFWKTLDKYNIPKKMILHQGEHIYINDLKGFDYTDIMHSWLDYWLYEINNDVMKKIPNVFVQSNLNQMKWQTSNSWPLNNGIFEINGLQNKIETIDDNIVNTVYNRNLKNTDEWQKELVLKTNLSSNNALYYLTDIFKSNFRLNGTVKVTYDAKIDKQTAILSALLVDYGIDYRLLTEQKQIINEDMKIFKTEKNSSNYKIITRGWLNAQNRIYNWRKDKIDTDKFYHYEFNMIPTDYTIKKGHKLGVILYGTDTEFTEIPFEKTEIKIKNISIKIPF